MLRARDTSYGSCVPGVSRVPSIGNILQTLYKTVANSLMQCYNEKKKGVEKMTITKKKGGRPSKKPDINVLNMLYQTMTAKQIAEHYDVKEATVRSWIARARKENE